MITVASLVFGVGLGASESEIIAISERQKCGFRLVNCDPVLDYVLSIGDTVVPSFALDALIEPDASLGGSIWWKEGRPKLQTIPTRNAGTSYEGLTNVGLTLLLR